MPDRKGFLEWTFHLGVFLLPIQRCVFGALIVRKERTRTVVAINGIRMNGKAESHENTLAGASLKHNGPLSLVLAGGNA